MHKILSNLLKNYLRHSEYPAYFIFIFYNFFPKSSFLLVYYIIEFHGWKGVHYLLTNKLAVIKLVYCS